MSHTLCQKCKTLSTRMTSQDKKQLYDSLKAIQTFIENKDLKKLDRIASNSSTKNLEQAQRYNAIYGQLYTNGRLKFNNATLKFISSLLNENNKQSLKSVLTFETTDDLDTEIRRTFLSVIDNYLTKLTEPTKDFKTASIEEVIRELTSITAYMGNALDKPFPVNYEISFQIKNDTDHSIISVVDKKFKALETYIGNTTQLVDSLVSDYIKNTPHTFFTEYVNDVLHRAKTENEKDKRKNTSKRGQTSWAILYHTARLLEKLARFSEKESTQMAFQAPPRGAMHETNILPKQISPEQHTVYKFKKIHKIVSSSAERILADVQTIKKTDKNEFITRLRDIESIKQIGVDTPISQKNTLFEPARYHRTNFADKSETHEPYDYRHRNPNTVLTKILNATNVKKERKSKKAEWTTKVLLQGK